MLSDGISTMVPGISERSNNVTRFSHLDRLGTNAHTSDASGNVVDSRSYDAFGLPTAASGPNVGVGTPPFLPRDVEGPNGVYNGNHAGAARGVAGGPFPQ